MEETVVLPSTDGVPYGSFQQDPAPDPAQLWAHQVRAVEFTETLWDSGRPGCMLAMGMGSGKTRVALALIRKRGFRQTLVICPKAVIPVWVKQAREFFPELGVCALDGSFEERRRVGEAFLKSNASKQRLFVTNYQGLQSENQLTAWLLWRSNGDQFGWNLIICDEIHKIKAPTGVTSKFLAKLGARAPYRLGLTGTPLPHSPLDAFSEYRFLDPSIFGLFVTKFRVKYCVMSERFRSQVVAWRNEDEFAQRLGWIMHQVKTEDVLQLPDAVHLERYVDLSESAEAYRAMEREFLVVLKDGREVEAKNVLEQLLRLQEITGGALRKEKLWGEKGRLLVETLDELPDDEPIVVFGKFYTDLDQTRLACEDSGRRCLELSGRVNQLAEWQAGEAPVLIAQISSGSLGVEMTRAKYAFYWSPTFNLAEFDQSLARTRRPGQKSSTVFYVHLIARGTVDERIYAALRKRKNVVESFLERARKSQGESGAAWGEDV